MTKPPNQDIHLIRIFHYLMGGLTGLASLIPIIHIGIGFFIRKAEAPTDNPQEAIIFDMVSNMFIVIGATVVIVGLATSICIVLAGRFLAQHRHYHFCLVIACLQCLNMPLGTALGIYTIITLNKPEVKEMFGVTSC